MKKLSIVLIALIFFGCQQQKKEIARLQAVQDSIAMEAAIKDSTILGFLTDINDIQANLDSIKGLEELITVERAAGVEMPNKKKQQILDDLATLNELLGKEQGTNSFIAKKVEQFMVPIWEVGKNGC